MAHVIEILRNTKAEARSFLDALFYSDFVSAIGYRPEKNKTTRAIAVDWNSDEETELDEQISQMITDALETQNKLDEIEAYCQIFADTVLYKGELSDLE